MSTYEERAAMCALNKIFGYHPVLGLELMQTHGGAQALFDGKLAREAADVSVPHHELLEKLVPQELDWAVKELEKVEKGGFRFLSYADDDYPDKLMEMHDPPIGLYLNGTSSPTEIFSFRPMVAFVGTRDLSPYGKAWCTRLVQELARARIQPCIVSGLALGADGVAHQTALENGLPTIGVMATGIEQIYPWQHQRLAMDIVKAPGSALITDYPLGNSPVALNFLRRNRIIAGLSYAVIVVESKTKGGSLMTARLACEYSRDVYALPGRADDIRSAGCNSLIREHMAEIITTPEMLVEALGLGGPVKKRGAGGSWATPAPDETTAQFLERIIGRKYGEGSPAISVCLAILEHRGISAEQIAAATDNNLPAVLSAIGSLEADGFIETDILRRCSVNARFTG